MVISPDPWWLTVSNHNYDGGSPSVIEEDDNVVSVALLSQFGRWLCSPSLDGGSTVPGWTVAVQSQFGHTEWSTEGQ